MIDTPEMTSYYRCFSALILLLSIFGCSGSKSIPVTQYYNYDHDLPLDVKIQPAEEHDVLTYHVSFAGIRQERITGLLSFPEKPGFPPPVIILIHGLGDHKDADYIRAGESFLREAGYAVLRIDLYNHGERKKNDYKFNFRDGYRYYSRDVVIQSVFDLRRTIDFIEQVENLDSDRIGYFGISLGGVIGTILSGTDDRIKVPVIALAGGRMNFMFGSKALSKSVKSYFLPVDPIHYVRRISPRPLLMINSDQDEVIPPVTSKFLYRKAKKPKEIIWYPARHKTLPVDQAFEEGIRWYQKYL